MQFFFSKPNTGVKEIHSLFGWINVSISATLIIVSLLAKGKILYYSLRFKTLSESHLI
jgi:hypothetical protein